MYDYVLLPVNTGESERVTEAFELATRLNFDLPDAEDATLVGFDENGATLGQRLCSTLATDGEIDSGQLLDFLNAHRPQLPDGEDLSPKRWRMQSETASAYSCR